MAPLFFWIIVIFQTSMTRIKSIITQLDYQVSSFSLNPIFYFFFCSSIFILCIVVYWFSGFHNLSFYLPFFTVKYVVYSFSPFISDATYIILEILTNLTFNNLFVSVLTL